MRIRKPQDYSQAEFEAVIKMIQNEPKLRADIEAVTGQKLRGKSPREVFDLFRTIQQVTEIQATVINYGRARQALADTRAQLEADASAEAALELARTRIKELEQANASLKRDITAQSRQIENVTAFPARAVYGEATAR